MSRVWAADYDYDFVRNPAKAVNDHGIAILNCVCGDTTFGRASIYRAHSYTDLTPPRMGAASDVVAVAINDRDQVLLYNHNTATAHVDFFLYDISHNSYQLIGVRGRLVSSPQVQEMRLGPLIGLNDDGEILTGYSGWIHSGDPSGVTPVAGVAYGKPALGEPGAMTLPAELAEFTQIPRAACLTPPKITGFNTQHQFTGSCVLRRGRDVDMASFILSADSFIEVAVPGAPWTEANAINSAGVVVGFYQPARGADRRAFVFDGKTYVTLMQRGAQPTSPGDALGLNNRGEVAGLVINEGDHGFIAIPRVGPSRPPPPGANPTAKASARLAPAAPSAASSPAARSYMGLNARMHDGVLTFTDSAGGGRTLSFSGVLPVRAAGGETNVRMWITRDAGDYVMFTLLPSGMVSGTPLPRGLGEQTYDRARRAQEPP